MTVEMNAKAKMAMLIQNCQGQMLGVEKFSSVIRHSEAAASRPTTAGLSHVNTSSTMGW